MKTIRFIKTKIEDKNAFLIMSKCNLCPYAFVTEGGKRLLCSYHNNTNTLVKSHLEFKPDDIFHRSFDDCDIPSWCNLPKNLGDEMNHKIVTYRYCGKLMEDESIYDKENEKPIFETCVVKGGSDTLRYTDHYKKSLKLKERYNTLKEKRNELNLVQNTAIPATVMDSIIRYNQVQTQTSSFYLNEICSCCGERKESVDRTVNNGMCTECYDNNKTNEDIEYNSVINNFRLKRKVSFESKIFKRVEF